MIIGARTGTAAVIEMCDVAGRTTSLAWGDHGDRSRRRRLLVATTPQLEHRHGVLRLHTVCIRNDHHGLRVDRPHLRVADVLVLEVQHPHLLDVRRRGGVGSVPAERLADRRVDEGVARETLEPL